MRKCINGKSTGFVLHIHALIYLQLVKFTCDFTFQASTKDYLALYLSQREINIVGPQASYISPI